MTGDKILGSSLESKSGRTSIPAKRVIDCIADGDVVVAFRADVPFKKGNNNINLIGGGYEFGASSVKRP